MPRMDLTRFTDHYPREAARLYPRRPVAPEVIAAYLTPDAIRRCAEWVTTPQYEAWKAEQANGHR